MSYVNSMIKAPITIIDLQQCFQVTLQRTVNGVVQTKITGDIGIIIHGHIGEFFVDPDGQWSWVLVSRIEINKWAR